jgi:hypothetical protein
MKRWLVVGCVLVGCSACGGSSEDSSDVSSESETTSDVQSPEQLQEALQDALQSAPQTPAVDYELLKALIPEVAGWERSEVRGEQTSMMNMSYSIARTTYSQGDASVDLEIMDTAMIQALVMPFTMVASGTFNQRSDDGFQRGTTIAGNPGWEQWQNQGESGEINILVGKRFLVKGQGSGLPSLDPVRQIVESVDLSRLATVK